MAGIAHFGVGLAAKRVAPKVPLWILLVASEFIDIIWFILFLLGIENLTTSPWSHGMFMSLVWSVLAGLTAGLIFHRRSTGLIIGLLVFSHWVLDFVSHPMMGGPPDLPLFFENSPKVGLGLYTALGMGYATALEVVVFAAGMAIYIVTRRQMESQTQKKVDIPSIG